MDLGLIVGNSRLHHARLADGELEAPGAFAWQDGSGGELAPLETLLDRCRPERVVVASVRPERLARLERCSALDSIEVVVLGRDRPVPVENLYRDPTEAGVDRLLNALVARRRWPGRAAAVIDCGTAISVAVVTPEGAFAGGPIALGLAGVSAGLRASLPRLPTVRPEGDAPLVARSTPEALGAGLWTQLTGGLQRLVDRLREELGADLPIALTGGDGSGWAGAIDGIAVVDPLWTLRGLAIAAAEVS